MDVVIRNGTIVTARHTYAADVGIEGGKVRLIGQISAQLPAAREIDATGKYLFPGGVDVHTHVDFAFGGHQTADDFYSGTAAAACGGVTTIVDYAMPESGWSIERTINASNEKARGQAVIDYGLHPVVLEPTATTIGEVRDVVTEGYPSFKIFTLGFARFDELVADYLKLMIEVGRAGGIINVHAEDHCLISHLGEKFTSAGKLGIRHFADSRPRDSEGVAVRRALLMAKYAATPVYFVHLSCEDSVNPILDARANGQVAYGETRPLYLHFTRERFEQPDGEGLIGWPPLRDSSQQDFLWRTLRAGGLQTVATDHCGFKLAQKKSQERVDMMLPGMSNLETMLPVLYSEGVGRGRLTLNRFVEVISTNPARLFGLYPQKGTIAAGSDADIVIFDPKKRVTIRQPEMQSRSDYDIFEGFEVTGWPSLVLSRGETIVENRRLLAKPGRGRLVKRSRFIVM
jgi:dihydropyrimidinase